MSDPYPPFESSPFHPSHSALGAREQIDIGEALSFPMKDPEWLTKCLIVGLVMFIPFIGPFVAMGWQRRVYDGVKQGRPDLPSVNIGEDIGPGFFVFGAMFINMMILSMLMMLVMGVFIGATMAITFVLEAITNNSGIGGVLGIGMMFLMYGTIFLMSIGINSLMPEVMRRAFNGELVPLLSPGSSISAIRSMPSAFLMTVLGMILFNMVGGLGVMACFIGLVVTIPLCYAMLAHLFAQYDAVIQANAEP